MKNNMKKICVIDGQGGGIGSHIIKQLRSYFQDTIEIIALGTNAIAVAQMLKSRANRGASGQNAIVQTVKQVDVITGPIGIVTAHAMMGEITPSMATAISASPARKLLIPLSQENIIIAGVKSMPLPRLVEAMIQDDLKPYLENE
jgi:hypothetical protein